MKKVMLVEDEEFILQGIRYIIDWEEIAMEVTSMAHNGKEALEMFRQEPADIVVTDVEMPLMNGLDLLEEIRKISPRTRFLILSGYDEFEYAKQAVRYQVMEYILKPVTPAELTEVLEKNPETVIRIDLGQQTVSAPGAGAYRFEINGYKKECLMKGYSDIDYLLSDKESILRYEESHDRA